MDLAATLRECRDALAAAQTALVRHDSVNTRDAQRIALLHKNAAVLYATNEVLEELDRTQLGAINPLGIKRWLSAGNFFESAEEAPTNTQQVYDLAGELLDDACAYEIFGPVVFEGENGKIYVISIAGTLAEADPEYAAEFCGPD